MFNRILVHFILKFEQKQPMSTFFSQFYKKTDAYRTFKYITKSAKYRYISEHITKTYIKLPI